jgi:hypothetical protein
MTQNIALKIRILIRHRHKLNHLHKHIMNEHPYFINNIGVRVMVVNATFNNISVISWRSVLLMEETGVPGENHRPAASH